MYIILFLRFFKDILYTIIETFSHCRNYIFFSYHFHFYRLNINNLHKLR